MMEQLSGDLPGGGEPSQISNDIATFELVLEEANSVIRACTIARELGWIVTGKLIPLGGVRPALTTK